MKRRLSGVKIGMVMMADRVFVDTNVLLRSLFDEFPESTACRETIFTLRHAEVSLWISRQVIREFLVQVTHPRTLAIPLTGAEASTQITSLVTLFHVTDETGKTTQSLLNLVADYPVSGKQIHDANIVASMLANEVNTLLTLNTPDFQRYSDQITILTPND